MAVMPEEEELRMEQQLHIIPDDGDDEQSTTVSSERQETFVCPHSCARGHFGGTMPSYEQALEGFAQVGLLAREIGSSVIKREAASVNQMLIDVQARMHTQKRRKLEGDAKSTKSHFSNPFGNERHLPVSLAEQESIAHQASRMKRMSLLLMNLETMHQLLLEEMIACAYSDLQETDES